MHQANLTTDRLDITGIPFDFILQEQIPGIIRQWRLTGHRGNIVVANPHAAMLCHRDPEMYRAMANADLNLPDGVGVILASKLLGYGRRHRCTGPALMLEVCDRGRESGFRHFFHGGGEGIAERLAERLCKRFPGLQVAGTCCPPFRPLSTAEDAAIISQINATEPDVVWVGLGAPKQEKWMAAHAGQIQAAATVGVGAAFDFHSGNVAWAPRWIRRTGLEWAWRLALHPRRMWRRNLDSPLFMLHVLAQMPTTRAHHWLGQSLASDATAPQASPVFALPFTGYLHRGAAVRQHQTLANAPMAAAPPPGERR